MDNVLLLCLLAFAFVVAFSADPSLSASKEAELMDVWKNQKLLEKTDISFEGLPEDFFSVYAKNIKPKIKYEINLGQKENYRRTIDSVTIKSFIDPISNIAMDQIEINFLGQKIDAPTLTGQEIKLTLHTDDNQLKDDDFSVIKVVAPGWKLSHPNNSDNWWVLRFKESKIFGNVLQFFIRIENQDSYKGRSISIYNRDAAQVDIRIAIKNHYIMTALHNSLPHYFLKKAEIHSERDLFQVKTLSSVLYKEVSGNSASAAYWLIGEDYDGKKTFSSQKPKKVINFDYSYEYQEDINLKSNYSKSGGKTTTGSPIKTFGDDMYNQSLAVIPEFFYRESKKYFCGCYHQF